MGKRGMAMSVLDSIIQWAQEDLYEWQSDAVRRLLTQDSLSAEDEVEIFAMLKAKKGIIEPEKPAPKPQPIKKGDISGAPQTKVNITLKSIYNLRNVNAIPDGSSLPFGHEGLSVIYGENATGKSGYARVLKRACNARDTKEKLLPNIYEHETIEPAKASFKISVNKGRDQEISWQDGKEEMTTIFSNICVFDSKCARIIVDENNETTYLPYGAIVFPALVELLKNIRSKIDKEKPKPQKPEYPDIPATTKVGEIISALTHETAVSFIEESAKWGEENETKLAQLKRQISDAENKDPAKLALRLRNTRDRINRLIESMNQMDTALSGAKEESIKETINNLNAAEKALVIASQQTLSTEPLKGAGEKTWQALYNAAKEYSINYAYPGQEFPVTGEGSLCVLCMQPLEKPGKERMIRFKEFMEKSTKKDVEKAQQALQEAIKEVGELEFPKPESYKDLLDEFLDKYPEVTKQVEEYFPAMETRAKELIKAATDKTINPFTPPKPNPNEEIEKIPKQLEAEALEIEKTAKPEELNQKINERKELEAQKLFKERKKDIIKYLNQLKLAKKYEQCYKETEFIGITIKGKNIIKEALTPQFKAKLKKELTELGAEHLPLKLIPSGEEGQTLHKIELSTTLPLKKANLNLSEILSEGEHCVVALAGFLAELQIADHECPIVLDDPVCSLDHKYMRRIAKRLIKEAEDRQVIIFTHDIAFMLELKDHAAESEKVSFTPQTVCRLVTIGKCLNSLPWHSMEVKERLKYLREELEKIKALYSSNRTEYNKGAANLYGLLRETWEALVEEKLLHKTIIRHGGEVQTQRLKSVTVDNDDVKKAHFAMKKCSTWMTGHDKPKALSENRPSAEEISQDIEELAQYSNTIGRRNKELRREREKYLEPKQATIG
jgi:recombinational DNA repair ATPase RecF